MELRGVRQGVEAWAGSATLWVLLSLIPLRRHSFVLCLPTSDPRPPTPALTTRTCATECQVLNGGRRWFDRLLRVFRWLLFHSFPHDARLRPHHSVQSCCWPASQSRMTSSKVWPASYWMASRSAKVRQRRIATSRIWARLRVPMRAVRLATPRGPWCRHPRSF